MSGPFTFIATNRLKPGAYESERRRVPGLVDFIEAGEPRLLAFNEYINAERTEVRMPSDAVMQTLRVQAGAGVPLSVHVEHLGGFTRI
jgi:hypothetical protein